MPPTIETALYKKYRAERQAVRTEMRALAMRRAALDSILTGLESILRSQGTDPDQIPEEDEQGQLQLPTDDADRPRGLIGAAVAALRSRKVPMGAKDIHLALLKNSVSSNYHTLYRTLTREAEKADSSVVRIDGRFGLSEWANNDTGTER
jgi:hypothetical protein